MRLLLLFSLSLCAGSAQPADTPRFDVASIRPSQGGEGRGGGHAAALFRQNIVVSPDGVSVRNNSLKGDIAWAYGVREFQVSGPDWLDTQRFDIAAKAAGAAPEDTLRLMMRALLAERFKLELHHQTKEMQAYVLVPTKDGPKVKESASQGESSVQADQARMQVSFRRTPLSQLVDLLYAMLRTPVVDETGLTGKYDLDINVAKYISMGPGDGHPPDPMDLILTGLRDELGLKLESRKVALDLLVIDRVEKTPGEN